MKELKSLNADLVSRVATLSENLSEFVIETRGVGVGQEISTVSRSVSLLKINVAKLVRLIETAPDKGMGSTGGGTEREVEALKIKYVSLQKEWESQQEHLGRLQGDLFSLRNQLREQSAFCASLGAVFGNLLWKVSRLESAIDLLISSNKLPELFSMANGTLASFLETYAGSGLPDLYSDETQFILSMMGVVANIAALPEGRHLLVSEPRGKELLEQIVHSLTVLPVSTGDPLLRILLMVAYNASINEGGLALLQDKKPLLVIATEIIACERSPDLSLIALRLLDSLTFHYPNIAVFNLHKTLMPIMKLNSLASAADAELRGYAQSILTNLEKGADLFQFENTTGLPADFPHQEAKLPKKVC